MTRALDTAMNQFWKRGYDATSISSLTRDIGITPPSLYAAFGDKRGLFDAVVKHYLEGPGSWMDRALDEVDDAEALIVRLLRDAARHYADPSYPGGCLMIAAAVDVTEESDPVAEHLCLHRNQNVERLAAIMRDSAPGTVLAKHDPKVLAEYVGVVLQGMSSRARDGSTAKELRAVADLALAGLGISAAVPAYREQAVPGRLPRPAETAY